MKWPLGNLGTILELNYPWKMIQHAKFIEFGPFLDEYIKFCGSFLSTNVKYPSCNTAKTTMPFLYIVRLLRVFPTTDFYEISVMNGL